jgi:hypothetical protein
VPVNQSLGPGVVSREFLVICMSFSLVAGCQAAAAFR